MGDRVNKWAPGVHYGPVLTQTDVYLLDADLELHPVLKGEDDSFQLVLNLSTGQMAGYNAAARDHDLPFADVKDQPATFPRADTLIIIAEISPWCTIVRNPGGVTLGDICNSLIADYKDNPVTDGELASLPNRVQDSIRRAAAHNATYNASYYSSPAASGRPTRADWLRDKLYFERMSKMDNYAKARLGYSAPNIFVMALTAW
ncbi:hypothetical protein CERSUDRAFT_117197 [Gelatoporia subvermispora B]|uniref:DUF6699 domain-containing protein n=1 Tax=Ceriporiopsis subvermispora (strain B) TaxID=914234 RepID=M2R7D5_CERS8|nr:hypothetical protein CERSUDRAFT_117197 [Gelatoporia subvermispora B]